MVAAEARLQREIVTWKELKHSGVVPLREVFSQRERNGSIKVYLVMDRSPFGLEAGSPDFLSFVNGQGQLTELQVQFVLYQLLEVITYMHSLTPPVMHRDIKPGE